MNVASNFHVVIVGAGVSGICMAKKLKDLGIRFVLLYTRYISTCLKGSQLLRKDQVLVARGMTTCIQVHNNLEATEAPVNF